MVEEIIFIYSFCSDLLKQGSLGYLHGLRRKYIETTFSQIVRLFPRAIAAATKEGFLMKILLFIVAYVFSIIFQDRALAKTC